MKEWSYYEHLEYGEMSGGQTEESGALQCGQTVITGQRGASRI